MTVCQEAKGDQGQRAGVAFESTEKQKSMSKVITMLLQIEKY